MDFLCDIFHLDFVHIVVFQVVHDLTYTITFQFTVFSIGKIFRKILQHAAPQLLQSSGDIQFIKSILFFIQTYDVFYISGKKLMPWLGVVNVNCGKWEVLYKWFYIFSAQDAFIRTINDFRKKGNGNIFSILHIFHETGMKDISVSEKDISGFHMVSTLIYFIKNLTV